MKPFLNIHDCWVELDPVPATAEMHEVFDAFVRYRHVPFLPVIDDQGKPTGVIREHDLKEYAYGRFGRELVQRQALVHFIKPTLILPHTISRDELLAAVANNPNPDGIVLTENGIYKAVLLNYMILQLFGTSREETQSRLAQGQKMEAIGTLAGGIAHDLNNILTPIIGYAELMREMLTAGEAIDESMLDQILVSGKRAQETVGRILSFSRHQKTEQCEVSLCNLILDDEFQVARLAQRYLSRFGLTVETEIDSSKVLAILQSRMTDFDIMVTDQTMPSISGLELAQQVLHLNPKFPIILCTGYSDLVSPETAKSVGIRNYLLKPTDYAKMAEVIRTCHASSS